MARKNPRPTSAMDDDPVHGDRSGDSTSALKSEMEMAKDAPEAVRFLKKTNNTDLAEMLGLDSYLVGVA